MSLAAGERHQLMMTLDAPSTEVGQGVGPGLRAGRLSNGVHDLFELLDALDEAGKFGRHARHVGLKVDHALGSLAGPLLMRRRGRGRKCRFPGRLPSGPPY